PAGTQAHTAGGPAEGAGGAGCIGSRCANGLADLHCLVDVAAGRVQGHDVHVVIQLTPEDNGVAVSDRSAEGKSITVAAERGGRRRKRPGGDRRPGEEDDWTAGHWWPRETSRCPNRLIIELISSVMIRQSSGWRGSSSAQRAIAIPRRISGGDGSLERPPPFLRGPCSYGAAVCP